MGDVSSERAWDSFAPQTQLITSDPDQPKDRHKAGPVDLAWVTSLRRRSARYNGAGSNLMNQFTTIALLFYCIFTAANTEIFLEQKGSFATIYAPPVK
jgi:hypothetical protein